VEATRRKKHNSIQLRYIVLACSLACSESMGVDWNASAILLHGAVERGGDGEIFASWRPKKGSKSPYLHNSSEPGYIN
jgi:hypothetical protein